ncbi:MULTISPECIES: hypothetical protein [unclassified Bacillus (in: firmicutes)]|nr:MULTISPECIES: hypothetical protein [unclassified Bacillus (in: firmicutes)]
MNHRSYLALAIPLTISTITTPLIGAVEPNRSVCLENDQMV